MQEVKAVIREWRLETVVQALRAIPNLPGITVSIVRGVGRTTDGHLDAAQFGETPMAKLEIVVPDELVRRVVDIIADSARTGRAGDGKIFVSPVTDAVRIRTNERGVDGV